MTVSQRRILCIVFLALSQIVFITALTAKLEDGTLDQCLPGTYCAPPEKTIETIFGYWNGRDMSHEQFGQYRTALIACSLLAEAVLFFTFMRMLKNRKTPTIGSL